MILTEERICELRESVKARLSESRYNHTLGVERATAEIARYIMPDRVYELRVAALLHDVTKELSRDEQLEIIKRCTRVTDSDMRTEAAYHAFSAPEVILRDYPELATPDVLSAVFNHTTGAPDMTVFDEIIFISDYVEDGRAHPACVAVRESLFCELRSAVDGEEMLCALHRATLEALENTVRHIESRGFYLNERTVVTKDEYLRKLGLPNNR